MIRVSAVVLRNSSGAVLTVRKRGTQRFMFPGGKPESGETALETAIRECGEELCLQLDAPDLALLGVFRAAAANEPGLDVEATVFTCAGVVESRPGTITPAAEIAELRWQSLGDAPLPDDLAPLLAKCVFPLLT
ncbi:NUDIX hydrolase [Gordonia sp. CPCC 205333]|uniref:NUDIX hydrolase n=1 Tax=Gordonia sp. CPCC 205333 TaxID=3140790 RepID=UPI003AF3805F